LRPKTSVLVNLWCQVLLLIITFFPKDLLELPEVIIGYYVSNVVGGIMVSGEVREKDRVGVAYSGEQAKGIQAFCELLKGFLSITLSGNACITLTSFISLLIFIIFSFK
jgi:hypothetical protein